MDATAYTAENENVVFLDVFRAFRADMSYAEAIAYAARKDEETAA